MSSNSPCGTNPHPDHVFDEASPYRPYMHYGRSKMLMEQAVGQYQRDGKIETVIIRAPWFYGPNQPPRQSLFFRMIRDGKGPIVGGGEQPALDGLCRQPLPGPDIGGGDRGRQRPAPIGSPTRGPTR